MQKITGIHFFSSEDNLGFALVTQPMKGDNYATWSSSTIMALIAGELKSLHSWKKKKKKLDEKDQKHQSGYDATTCYSP